MSWINRQMNFMKGKNNTLKVLLGIIKFLGAGIVFAGFSNSLVRENLNDWKVLLQVLLIVLIFGIYIYYLVRTGIWNFKNGVYKKNIFVIIGHVIHCVLTFLCLYYEMRYYKKEFFFTVMLIFPFMILCGFYDFKKLYGLWKSKQAGVSN
jgi:cation transport ATPase